MRLRALALVLALLAPRLSAAQAEGEPAVALEAVCPAAIPTDLGALLELELQERVAAGPAPVLVRVTTPCERAGRELEIVVTTRSGARLGPMRLDLTELGPRIRGRVAAIWVAEHVRIARGEVNAEVVAPIVSAPPPPRRAAPPASSESSHALAPPGSAPPGPAEASPSRRSHQLIRANLGLALHHDVVSQAVGPGADLRLELGARGEPGVALELGLGGTGLARSSDITWTELRASLGGVLDVMLDHAWGAAFGARLLFVHEVFTGFDSRTQPYRIADALDIRASAFAAGRLYLHEGLSLFAEVELGVFLHSFVPGRYRPVSEQNLVQGVLRVGVGLD